MATPRKGSKATSKRHSHLGRAVQTSLGVALAISPFSTLSIRAPDDSQRNGVLISTLNNSIELVSVANQLTSILNSTPLAVVQGVLATVNVLLTRLRVISDQFDYKTLLT